MAGESSRGISYEPLANGLDYAESAFDHLSGEPTDRDLKYALLHLAAAIEVLLKTRLSEEHWTLILTDVDKVTRAKYEAGDFRTIGIEQAIHRLREVAAVEVEREDQEVIAEVIKRRNRLQHHGLHESVDSVRGAAARGLDFLLRFVKSELAEAVSDEEHRAGIEDLLVRLDDRLHEANALVGARLERIEPELDSAEVVVECPDCRQMTLLVDGDETRCLFCEFIGDAEDVAERYAETILGLDYYSFHADGAEEPVRVCPECERHCLVYGPVVRGEGVVSPCDGGPTVALCFNDAMTFRAWEISDCDRCGQPATRGDGNGGAVCPSCDGHYRF